MSRTKSLSPEASPHGGSSRPSQSKSRAPKTPSASPASSSKNTTDAEHERDHQETRPPSPIPASPSMLWKSARSGYVPTFVASLGNPKPYLNTLHSAGHIVLAYIAAKNDYDPWRPMSGGQVADKERGSFSFLGGSSKTGGDPLPTLWRSGAMMNVSGKAVKRAWTEWKKQNGLEKSGAARLVIVHDELEKELGAVTVRTDPKLSARGHNGIKSLQAAFAGEPFIRIGVGIGRPESRDRDAVSNYVLKQITVGEAKALENASLRVMQQIEEVAEGAIG